MGSDQGRNRAGELMAEAGFIVTVHDGVLKWCNRCLVSRNVYVQVDVLAGEAIVACCSCQGIFRRVSLPGLVDLHGKLRTAQDTMAHQTKVLNDLRGLLQGGAK
jgi:hypothetical protein